MTRATLLAAAGNVFVLLVLLAAALVAGLYLYGRHGTGLFLFDFEGTILRPVRAVFDGVDPYPAPTVSALDTGNPAVYPPPSFLLAAPLLLLPSEAAGLVWTAALLGCILGALRLLAVRDWRAYGLALTSFPVVHGAMFGNLTIALVLGVALAWRLRDRVVWTGVVVGLVVALKLFLLPLVLWLLLTRRHRAAAVATSTAVGTLLGGWALIGFTGLADYPSLLRVLSDVFGPHSLSAFAALTEWGVAEEIAQPLVVVLALGICVAARFGSRAGRDARVFAAVILAALLSSPIVWPHYYALLVVVLPLVAPRAGAVWLVLPATWLAAFALPYDEPRTGPCCRPAHVPNEAWLALHAPPPVWQGVAFVLLAAIVLVALTRAREVPDRA